MGPSQRTRGSGCHHPRGARWREPRRQRHGRREAVTTRIAVVAPYPALRAGLRAMLQEHGLTVDHEAATLEALTSHVVDAPYDVAIVDPGQSAGLDGLGDAPGPLVVLGPLTGAEALPNTLMGRGWAYLPREADAAALAAATRAAAAGLVVIDRSLAGALMPARVPTPIDPAAPLEELSPREREVLALVAEGYANKQIAQRLVISEHTVKFHVAAILAKLGAASRTEAVRVATRRGLIAL